ncbi:HlyD family secretion protein [Cyanothece sp. BG0011]|uniref:HlyD family secretion protein n=1 Tax=Cyanothece sp. BG0011 TaxID=2082950 RepID=UPI001E393FA7|nr:efflux RND transporter periplasmic adaptor subunit [Cyanothece sp. BG0011]
MSSHSPNSMQYKSLPDSEGSEYSSNKGQKKGIRSWITKLIILFLIAGGLYFVYRQIFTLRVSPNQRPLPVRAERANLKVSVSANGTVEPKKLVNVSPKNAGILKELWVEEGDYVQQGQLIAKMDDSNLLGQLLESEGKLAEAQANLRKLINGNRSQEIAQAEAKLEQLEANLNKLITGYRSQEIAQAKARLANAKATFEQAEDEFKRDEILFKEGAISQLTLNEQRAIRDSAKAEVTEAEEELSLMNEGTRQEEIEEARAEVKAQREALSLLREGTREEEIAQARAEVQSTKGSLQTIKTEIEDTMIRAPFNGIVSSKYADPGAFVTPMTSGSAVSSATSTSILSLASENEILSNVSENNIAKIKVGQTVGIEADAFAGIIFEGKVSQIAPQATVEQNVTSFEVKVELSQEAQQQLRSGMNVSVEFYIDELTNVLTVPTIAVTRKDNTTGVYIVGSDLAPEFVSIVTGASSDSLTEVKSGLDGSEHILTEPPPSDAPPKPGFSLSDLFTGGSNNEPPGGGPPGGGPPGGGPPGGGPPP